MLTTAPLTRLTRSTIGERRPSGRASGTSNPRAVLTRTAASKERCNLMSALRGPAERVRRVAVGETRGGGSGGPGRRARSTRQGGGGGPPRGGGPLPAWAARRGAFLVADSHFARPAATAAEVPVGAGRFHPGGDRKKPAGCVLARVRVRRTWQTLRAVPILPRT